MNLLKFIGRHRTCHPRILDPSEPVRISHSEDCSLSRIQPPNTFIYAIHTSTGYSPLHQAVNHGIHRISLTLACTGRHGGPQVLAISAVLRHFGSIAGPAPTSGGTPDGHPPRPLGSSGLEHGQSSHPTYSRFLSGSVPAGLPRFLLQRGH